MLLGLVICLVCGLLAVWLGGLQHIIGGPMLGLFLGIIIANALPAAFIRRVRGGASFSSKYLLKAGIILAGGTLSFKAILGVGLSALPLIVFNICLSFFIAFIVGRAFGVSKNTRVLVGGGTAICGGTAIATLTPIVDAREDEMAYAMTAIFLFDILAALMWPYVARALAFSPEQYGILGGLAISDTSSVTAAGATFDALMGDKALAVVNGESISAGSMAVVVKLTRTVMLVFVAIAVMAARLAGRKKSGAAVVEETSLCKRALKAFPLFVLGFLVMAVLNTLIGFSGVELGSFTLSRLLSKGYKYLISAALVGVGCKIKLRDLFTKGAKPVLLGGCTWAAVAASTLGYLLIFT